MISEIISTHFYIPEPGTHAEKILAGRWALDWSSEAEETVMLFLIHSSRLRDLPHPSPGPRAPTFASKWYIYDFRNNFDPFLYTWTWNPCGKSFGGPMGPWLELWGGRNLLAFQIAPIYKACHTRRARQLVAGGNHNADYASMKIIHI